MTVFGQWLPAIAKTPAIRKGALTAAGLAFVGGAIAGPLGATAQAAPASPAPAMTTVADVTSDKSGDNSSKELKVDYQAQSNYYYCAPASTRNALSADGKNVSQDDVASKLGTTVNGTNSAEDTTRVLNDVTGGNTYKTTAIPDSTATSAQVDQLQADVKNAVDNNRVVVANIIGTATDTDGDTHSYSGGHYLDVVGYRDGGKTVEISDPANPSKPTYWMNTTDMANWIASRGYSA